MTSTNAVKSGWDWFKSSAQMVWASINDDPVEVSPCPLARSSQSLHKRCNGSLVGSLIRQSAAAEVLLLQDDMERLSKVIGRQSDEDSRHDQYFVNGMLTSDGMMKQSSVLIGVVRVRRSSQGYALSTWKTCGPWLHLMENPNPRPYGVGHNNGKIVTHF
jgi:hypothetical protein